MPYSSASLVLCHTSARRDFDDCVASLLPPEDGGKWRKGERERDSAWGREGGKETVGKKKVLRAQRRKT